MLVIKLLNTAPRVWQFMMGQDDKPLRTWTHISMQDVWFFRSRKQAVEAAAAVKLSVDKKGMVS